MHAIAATEHTNLRKIGTLLCDVVCIFLLEKGPLEVFKRRQL